MDNLYGAGYRSPCVSMQQHQGSTTPAGQGRSVREYEEQMTALRKENFNLKLRLYFLEESLPGFQQQQGNASSEGQDNLLKQLIDSKVEKEILRKEIQEQQELLKDAAGAMVQMESTQKQLELKCQSEIEELKQKILYFEMERDHDKTNNAEYIHEVLGRTELCDNMDIIQKIRQLEELLKQSEEKNIELQLQISKLDEILIQRDESIKEYEDKVKELVFQNAELLESLENKEKEISNAERIVRSLRQTNYDFKEDNENLLDVLRGTQENFRKELISIKMYEKQMRDQQDALSQMQSAISTKTTNTARLLERIQDYEKMVTKMNFERNITKRENRFFRAIIHKLQNRNECYAINKKSILQQFSKDLNKNLTFDGINSKSCAIHNCREFNGEFQGEYKLQQKLLVNISNNSGKLYGNSCYNSPVEFMGEGCHEILNSDNLSAYQTNRTRHQLHPGSGDNESYFTTNEIPIRYTFSDGSVFAAGYGGVSQTNSSTSLQANFSSSSLFMDSRDEVFIQDHHMQQSSRKKYTPIDGIRYVYSKFGNIR